MTVNRIINFAANALTAIAGVALIGLVGMIAVDVVFRNLGMFHIRGVLDYVSLALIILPGCAIPAAFVGGRHVVVEMGTFAMKASSKARLEAIWLLLAVRCWRSWAGWCCPKGCIWQPGTGPWAYWVGHRQPFTHLWPQRCSSRLQRALSSAF